MEKAYTLITGATGFIGSHVVDRLLQDGRWPVVAIVRGGKGYKNTAELEKQGAVAVRGPFHDRNLLTRVFRKFPIRHVVHIAALAGEGKGSRKDYDDVNVRGTDVLLSVSQKNRVEKFIFCSSVGVFGTIPGEAPARLTTPVNPDNIYHQSKLSAEQKVYDFIDQGLDAYIVRPTITYGEGDGGFPATLVRLVRTRCLMLPFQENRIHLLSVHGLADMFLKLLTVHGIDNRVFIAGDEGPVVLRELVDLIHFFYFGRDYPRFLKMPNWGFKAFEAICGMMHDTKWLGRIQRISRDWYFDTHRTDVLLGIQPANTQQEFLRYLGSLT